MSRTSDEQIAEWRAWSERSYVEPELANVLDALEAERTRADAAERAVLVERERGDEWRAECRKEISFAHLLRTDLAKALQTIDTLWKSRRKWQQEVEVTRSALMIYRALMELAEDHLEKIRVLHRQEGKYCICEEMWPCQTVEILSGTK